MKVSYGIIPYTYNNDEIKILMTIRRDTFCYECILRGFYDNDEILYDYIKKITEVEKDRILKYPFNMLWKDLWVSTKKRSYRFEYKKAYSLFTNNYNIIISKLKELTTFLPNVWEFPKGKIYLNESSLDCALREFNEETNLSICNIKIIKQAGIFDETVIGNDNKIYNNKYYIGLINNGENIKFLYNKCKYNMREDYISDEVMYMKWLTFNEALSYCDDTKKIILEKLYLFLTNKPFNY